MLVEVANARGLKAELDERDEELLEQGKLLRLREEQVYVLEERVSLLNALVRRQAAELATPDPLEV